MEYVYAVYQEGSISAAAKKLFMTQPALSMAIRRVENKLGETLFDRSQHPLQLTSVGKIYIQKYREIKYLERELDNQIHDLHKLQQGELVLGGTQFILSYVLAPVFAEFSKQYPNISIQILETRSDRAMQLLLDGRIDTCLRCSTPPPTITPIDFAFQDHLLIAVPKHYLAQYDLPPGALTLDMVRQDAYLSDAHPGISFEHLGKLPYVLLSDGNNLRSRFLALCQEHGVTPNISIESEQLTTSFYLANSGLGATCASVMMIKKSISDNLVFYKINSPLLVRDFYFAGRHKGYVSKATTRFIRLCQAHYQIPNPTPMD